MLLLMSILQAEFCYFPRDTQDFMLFFLCKVEKGDVLSLHVLTKDWCFIWSLSPDKSAVK